MLIIHTLTFMKFSYVEKNQRAHVCVNENNATVKGLKENFPGFLFIVAHTGVKVFQNYCLTLTKHSGYHKSDNSIKNKKQKTSRIH